MIRSLTLLLSTALILSACGTNSPLTVIQTGESAIPELGLPVSVTNTGGFFATGTSLTSSTFTFVLGGGFGSSLTPLAPANGAVIDQNGTTVTIMHNSRLSTRISNVANLTVRLGDYITKGSQISATQFANVGGSGSGFTFEVFLDGVKVCPWSFFSTDVRSQLINISTSGGLGFFAQGVCTQ